MTRGEKLKQSQPAVRVIDGLAMVVGIVIGAGIFRTPSIVAGNAPNSFVAVGVWAIGGAISLIGALVYAELTTTYPHTGGEYHYLMRAFGWRVAFLFAWARLTVIQTGSIATFAFVSGDYLGQVWPLGAYTSPIYATLIVVILTLVNIAGVREGTRTQTAMTAMLIVGMIVVIVAGFSARVPISNASDVSGSAATASSAGLMMVFVLFTYGGWNEAAYLSGEVHNARRNMVRVLVLGITIITTLYVLINAGYLHTLGLAGAAKSELIAAEVMRVAFGEVGATLISIVVVLAALTSANATIFTGARSAYAFGTDFRKFNILGHWNPRTGTPTNALAVQGTLSLALVLLGTLTRRGFETTIAYTAPVFWFFFLLTGISLFVLRRKEFNVARAFRVPLYPITPILFCLTCAYLFYSSLAYAGVGAMAGVGVLALGAVVTYRRR